MMYLLVAVGVLLLLSAFFSGTETAVMAVDRYRVRTMAKEGDDNAALLLQYLDDPERFFGVVLLGNTFANIAAASLFTLWLVLYKGDVAVMPGTVFLTILVLLFCELLPKSLAARYALPMSFIVIRVIAAVEWLLWPLLCIVRWIVRRLTGKGVQDSRLKPDDLRRVIKAASAQLSVEEQDMLDGVLDLSELSVDEVMLPKHLVPVVDLSQAWPVVEKAVGACSSNYILVVNDRHWSRVWGVLYVSDLVSLDKDLDLDGLKHLLRDVSYVQEGTPLNTQLAKFKKSKKEVSIVVDEYGHTLGLLDVHDIIEEVVGYYANRCAVPIGAVRFDGKSGYFVRADVSIRDLNRYLHWRLPEDKGTTVAGMVLQCIGGIPEGGCAIKVNGYVVEVVDIRNNRLILTYIKVG